MPEYAANSTLDCCGTFCPVPVIRTAEKVAIMIEGQVLEVLGDDPGMQIDIPAWCISKGHQLLGVEIINGITHCFLQVGRGENSEK